MGTTELTATRLTPAEKAELDTLEEQIKRSMSGFVEAGSALLQIRDERLYRDDHETFELYCRDRWLIGKAYAHRLIESAKVVHDLVPGGADVSARTETLSPIGDKVSPATESKIGDSPAVLPTHESQARELAKAPADKRAEVWKAAVAAAPKDKATGKPKVTAAGVKAAAEKVGGVKPAPKRDRKGKGSAPVQPAPGSKGSDPEKLATAENLATPAADEPEIDELEAATRDAPSGSDPSQPWAEYNALLEQICRTLEETKGLLLGLRKRDGMFPAFAAWVSPKEQGGFFDSSVAVLKKHIVTNWASATEAARLPDGRNFFYAGDPKSWRDRRAKA